MPIKFWGKQTPLDKLSESELRAIVMRQERTFKSKDRELIRIEGKRRQLLEQAKSATPTQLKLLREKYKVLRNDRELIADEYTKSLAMYRITNQVHQIKRASMRRERAVDIAQELSSKTGLNPEMVRNILNTHGVDDEVKLEPWKELAEELDQAGVQLSEETSESFDQEFDTIVTTLNANPSARVDDVIKETEANLAKEKSPASLEG